MKKNIRTIGIDDAAFSREKSTETFVFGVVVRGNNLVEGVLRTKILVDGLDATEKIIEMINRSKFQNQIKAIVLGSATIAAFNIINMVEIFQKTAIPIISILHKLPDNAEVKKALVHLPDWEKRFEILMSNPALEKIEFINVSGRACKIYVQYLGFKDTNEIKNLLKNTCYTSCIPESLRFADMIGQSFKDYMM
ncbi:MAG: hypothetical protein HeimAB125_00950 [Candidatus Heimdallarchaeota archaeon AB_125]|nr:MAG: hypothetical protein HeimAB125_00950 [Candidatus Heimdallarchaeota archaeon AB_125]